MRTGYYIISPTSSGKTTSAKRLASELGIKCYHADFVYNMLVHEYNLECEPALLTRYEFWDNPEKFGISTWGPFSSIHEAKRPMYKRLLDGEIGDFVIEGFTLSFPDERKLVCDAIGDHRVVIIYLDLSIERWRELFLQKNGPRYVPSLADYNRLRSCFRPVPGETVVKLNDPGAVQSTNILEIIDGE